MEELQPPKPRANLGRKRGEPQGKRNYSVAIKAKISAQRTLREQNKKIENAQNKFHTAKRKKENILKTDDALKGKNSTVLDSNEVEQLSPKIQEHVKENIVFEPNKGPQTEFLASSEREVFYGGARGGGKSYAMLVDPLRYCYKEHHRALLLRRSMPELRDT